MKSERKCQNGDRVSKVVDHGPLLILASEGSVRDFEEYLGNNIAGVNAHAGGGHASLGEVPSLDVSRRNIPKYILSADVNEASGPDKLSVRNWF